MTLEGKRIVVLGGSSGIGLAIAQAAAVEGAKVVVASSNQGKVNEALKSMPASAEGHAADLGSEAGIKALFERIGDFDHLAYTAADKLQLNRVAETDLTKARKFFELRYWGALTAVKYASPHIRPGGSIVLTSGLAGLRPHAGWALGASVCCAMEGLTRALAVELAPIRVNIVAPGVVVSPLWDDMTKEAREALYRQMAERLLVRHAGETEEVAQSYLYLMRQTFGTGAVLRVDGGGALV
jgi:NAD(P)-dependent dehydrogenase (short-subunit alcohol dehydrogenase family)